MQDAVYLDHNATTPVHPEVVEAMLPYLTEHWGNPSSSHRAGRAARRGVERAREQVASLIGARPTEVVFTSGGTESDNLAIHGVLQGREGAVLTSPFEHPAVAEPVAYVEAEGRPVHRLPVDADGRCIVPEALPDGLALITVMLAHNETGALQPVAELAAMAGDVPVHTDAAQAVGKVEVDVDALGVDLLTIAGHKLYAPKGVGALYVRQGTELAPFARGASHEAGRRPGTENVAGVVALGMACHLAEERLVARVERMATLRERLWEHLAVVPGLRRTVPGEKALPNTLHVRFPDLTGTRLLARCPGVAASTGSACHAGEERPSGSLLAMGLSPDDAMGAVRLSLGSNTTPEDVDRAGAELVQAWQRLVS